MKSLKYIKTAALELFSAMILTTSAVYLETSASPAPSVSADKTTVFQVSPLTIVNSPKSYLNKTVLMNARFDKFSTLGLDYKPAFKSSEDYISFLVKRDDTSYDIPLSEMKLFIKRDEAEKFIDLKTNDKVRIKGVVFSDALGDAWVDVQQLTVVQKQAEEKKDGVE